MTHTAAFAHFGTRPRNVQWSWSARSEDGATVVATFWQDLFERKDGRLVYASCAKSRDDANGSNETPVLDVTGQGLQEP
jgi:hypothetical protein